MEEKRFYYSASELLPEILKNCEGKAGDKKKRIIRERWQYIIGRRLHQYGSYVKTERNILYIQAESQNYVTIFKLNQRGIISRYNEIFPNDRVVSLVVYSDSSMYSHQF